ncbi:hypothetical protein EWM64_g9620 [Hericium alpestre]|uniref:Uncharacterized protein n=1 Tax=Hericium alpestre TaxID=135208 RepID=A0A4Y9ZIB2_9AGAM|nr:hypothetical protein EWM64_g9620 [Hericium alpestre]
MRVTPLFAPLIAFVLSPAVRGIELDWYTTRSCDNGASEVYRNVA